MKTRHQDLAMTSADEGRVKTSFTEFSSKRLPVDELLAPHAVDRALFWAAMVAALLLALGGVAAFTIRIETSVDVVGILQPRLVSAVRAPGDGVVGRVMANSGDAVVAGDTLLEIESNDLMLRERRLILSVAEQAVAADRLRESRRNETLELAGQLRAAEARVVAARTQFGLRAADLGIVRNNIDSLVRSLVPGKHLLLDDAAAVVNAAEVEAGLMRDRLQRLNLYPFDSAAAHQRIEQTRIDLDETRSHIARNVVVAPIAGLVTTDDLRRLSGTFVRRGDLLVELSDTSTWEVVAHLSADDVSRIRIGQRAVFEVYIGDGIRPERREGTVSYVASEPATGAEGNRNAGFRVVMPVVLPDIEPSRHEQRLKRGYSLRTKIIMDSGVLFDVFVRSIRRSVTP